MLSHTLLLAIADDERRAFLAAQLDADGHTVYEADDRAGAVAKLSTHPVTMTILGELEEARSATALLRDVREANAYPRVHPAQPIITLGASDELTALRAYDSGSDHHLASDVSYLLLRSVLGALARRSAGELTSRHLYVGELHIDTAARRADVDGTPVKLTRSGYVLLRTLAGDPQRLFSKDELTRVLWGDVGATRSRALDSHICHLRRHLADAGAELITNVWGQGYALARGDDR